ncbi:unnamed protein product, partial [Allacma fusca]
IQKNAEILINSIADSSLLERFNQEEPQSVVHFRRIAEWMINWKWKLSALNVFQVNYSVLPSVI